MGLCGERWSHHRADDLSIEGTVVQSHAPTAVLILRQFRSPHICLCLLEETLKLKAGGPFYLASQWINV